MIALEKGKRFLYQWELNQRVIVDGFTPGTRVEFSARYDCKNSAIPVSSYEEGGHVYAPIPNILLQSDGYIRVYVNPSPGDPQNPQEKEFRVIRREKPENYEYSETPSLSINNKIDKYWGSENKGKALVIGDDGYVTASTASGQVNSGISAKDDGKGNVTISLPGSLKAVDDGIGNVFIR